MHGVRAQHQRRLRFAHRQDALLLEKLAVAETVDAQHVHVVADAAVRKLLTVHSGLAVEDRLASQQHSSGLLNVVHALLAEHVDEIDRQVRVLVFDSLHHRQHLADALLAGHVSVCEIKYGAVKNGSQGF